MNIDMIGTTTTPPVAKNYFKSKLPDIKLIVIVTALATVLFVLISKLFSKKREMQAVSITKNELISNSKDENWLDGLSESLKKNLMPYFENAFFKLKDIKKDDRLVGFNSESESEDDKSYFFSFSECETDGSLKIAFDDKKTPYIFIPVQIATDSSDERAVYIINPDENNSDWEFWFCSESQGDIKIEADEINFLKDLLRTRIGEWNNRNYTIVSNSR